MTIFPNSKVNVLLPRFFNRDLAKCMKQGVSFKQYLAQPKTTSLGEKLKFSCTSNSKLISISNTSGSSAKLAFFLFVRAPLKTYLYISTASLQDPWFCWFNHSIVLRPAYCLSCLQGSLFKNFLTLSFTTFFHLTLSLPFRCFPPIWLYNIFSLTPVILATKLCTLTISIVQLLQ